MVRRLRRSLLLLLVVCLVLTGLTPPPAWAGEGDNYPWKDTTTFPSCMGTGRFDDWGMCKRYCTSWVAWALHNRNSFEIPFHGDAKDFGPKAEALEYPVDTTPAKGAVAWWDGNHGGGYGHVAYVESVSSDGQTVTISEYNNPAGDGTYNSRTIAKSAPTGYIHFKDLASGSGTTPPPTPHLFEAFHWNTNSGVTEVRKLDATTNHTTWVGGWSTPDGWHGGDAVDYGMADANGDGVQDLYVILYCCTNSGKTEVKILNGASNFTTWVGGWQTADSYHAPGTVRYAVGKFDADAAPDLYVIPTVNTPSGHVEVKVLSGASNFSQWIGGWVTPEGWHDADSVDFVLSKCGSTSGRPYLYQILHENTPSGMTEVKQFDAATSYQTYVGGWSTPDGTHDGDHVAYTAGGCNANGKPNIYVVAHSHTNSGMTEVRVLNGAHNFGQWVGGWSTPDGWHSGFDIDFVMPLS